MNKRKITYDEYKSLVSKVCHDITASEWKPDYVVGITRGGLLPAVMISQYFDCKMHTIDISLRDGNSQESNLWMSEDAYGYNAEKVGDPVCKNILVVDDINDQGSTLNWLMADWQTSCLPNDARWDHVWNQNVKFAVVIDNLASKCNVAMDFCGEEINKAENDVWIEFPYEEWWV